MEGIKSIPTEFNKGVEMGEIDARSRMARSIDNIMDVHDDDDDDIPIINSDDDELLDQKRVVE